MTILMPDKIQFILSKVKNLHNFMIINVKFTVLKFEIKGNFLSGLSRLGDTVRL